MSLAPLEWSLLVRGSMLSRRAKKVAPVSSQRSYSHSRRLVLSAQERKFNGRASSTCSESAWQRINASLRPVGQIKRERESRRLFHGTLQLDRMALITSLEIPRMFGDEKLCYEGSFWKVVKTQSFGPQWNLVHVIRPHAQVFKIKKYIIFFIVLEYFEFLH